jgi:hypothetical protein
MEEPIYIKGLHQEDEKVLEQITAPKNWGYERFKQVMVALASVHPGVSVPAPNRPESIHVQNIRKHIDDLTDKTVATGHEHSRVIFGDKEQNAFVLGKVVEGTDRTVGLDTTPQQGKETQQRMIASIHTHPTNVQGGMAHGFSDGDYNDFLTNPKEQAMFITFGKDNILMALKTSVTPNNLTRERIKQQVKETYDDVMAANPNKAINMKFVDFNKAVCMELGLTLYRANAQSKDLMERVNVTSVGDY